MRFRKCSSCVSRHNKQQRSSKHGPPSVFTAESSRASCPPHTRRIEKRSRCAPRAQPITTGAHQRYATMMKYYDCASHYAVNRFLEPFTECASVSDDKNRYFTGSGLRDCKQLCMYVQRALSCHSRQQV